MGMGGGRGKRGAVEAVSEAVVTLNWCWACGRRGRSEIVEAVSEMVVKLTR